MDFDFSPHSPIRAKEIYIIKYTRKQNTSTVRAYLLRHVKHVRHEWATVTAKHRCF